jgi:hypothetical protein
VNPHSNDARSWIEELEFVILDRSDLELWATCPAQAKLVADKACIRESVPMLVGQEGHDVLSGALQVYMDMALEQDFEPWDLRREFEQRMFDSRPDVQPSVCDNIKRMNWEWCRFIMNEIGHRNILRYDGGKGEHSGQLSHDNEVLRCRYTSEIDLLHAGPSPDVLHEIDYKTGWTPHNAASVKSSFQFQMHAALVFSTYPGCQALETRVWRTAINQKTYRVVFERKDFDQYLGRVGAAAMLAMMHKNTPIARVPAWPEQDKCGQCPVSHKCPQLECQREDPVGMLEKLVVIEKAEDVLRKKLIAAAKSGDIVTAAGDRFSAVMPKSTAKWKVTTAKKTEEAESEESE